MRALYMAYQVRVVQLFYMLSSCFKGKQAALGTEVSSQLLKQKRNGESFFHVSNCFQSPAPVKGIMKCVATEYRAHNQNNEIQRSLLIR